jgi:hypothetical protein
MLMSKERKAMSLDELLQELVMLGKSYRVYQKYESDVWKAMVEGVKAEIRKRMKEEE